jgi:small subunit ribosomal protein S4
MSKYRGPRLRVIRRLGRLPALTKKVPKRKTRPGQHGSNRRKPTQFSYRLIEKQKLRFHYGLSEKKLILYIKSARKAKGSTGQVLLQKLELRLDNVVYRLGLAPTLPAARQLVNHGHILVNKKRVNIPSYLCRASEIITVEDSKKSRDLVQKRIKERVPKLPNHLSWNIESFRSVVSHSDRCETPVNLNELLVIEYYSNRLLNYLYFSNLCLGFFFLLF